jgi:hypothetical protein
MHGGNIQEIAMLLDNLMIYERQCLIDALRRDMRAEEQLVHTDPYWAQWHEQNARRSRDLLEQLNPKHASQQPSITEVTRELAA